MDGEMPKKYLVITVVHLLSLMVRWLNGTRNMESDAFDL